MPVQAFITTIAGVNYHPGSQTWLNRAKAGDALELRPEPGNPHDPHAVEVYVAGLDLKLGYVPRYFSKQVSELLAAGKALTASIYIGGGHPGFRVEHD